MEIRAVGQKYELTVHSMRVGESNNRRTSIGSANEISDHACFFSEFIQYSSQKFHTV